MTVESDERTDSDPRDDDRTEAAPPPVEPPLDEVESPDVAEPSDAVAVEAPDAPEPDAAPVGDVMRAHLKGLIEALVFVSDQPMTLNDIAKQTKGDRKLVRELLDELKGDYAHRGVRLEEVANGFVFRTSAVYAPFIRDSVAKKPVRMTRAQLETLAIVAYRQPITRPEIDDIRGVDSGPVLKMLLERDLVRILGKKDEPGRPLLYGTTPQFLQFFGLKSLKDLPTLREFTELSDDSRRVLERELGDAAEPAPVTRASDTPMPEATEVVTDGAAAAETGEMADEVAGAAVDEATEVATGGADDEPIVAEDPTSSFDAPTDPGSAPILSDEPPETEDDAPTAPTDPAAPADPQESD